MSYYVSLSFASVVNDCRGGFTIKFQPICLEDKEVFERYFHERYYEGSECTFTNFFMWRKPYGLEWAMAHDCLCIKATHRGMSYMLAPFGSENQYVDALNEMKTYFQQQGLPFLLKGVPRWMKEIMEQLRPGDFAFREDRNNYDYVYNAVDLCELKGRKYHRKRNHIKRFKQEYPDFAYQPITADLVQACIDNELEWCEKRECDEDPSLRCEKFAVIEALNHFSALGFSGGAIFIKGKIEAFTFGEALNKDTAVIHVEKGNPDIKGIYSVINQEYCRHNWREMTYINREEDMGIEGLRIAKEGYFPVKMIEKFDVTLK